MMKLNILKDYTYILEDSKYIYTQ